MNGQKNAPVVIRNFERPNLRKLLSVLGKYLHCEKKRLIGLSVLTLVLTGLGLITPAVVAEAIDWIPQIGHGKNIASLLLLLVGALGLYLLQILLSYKEEILSSRFFLEIASRMRVDYFKKITSITMGYLDTCRHGDLLSRGSNDIETVVKLLSETLMKLVSGTVLFVGSLAIMINVSWQLTCICLCSTGLTFVVSTVLAHFIRKHTARQQTLLGNLNGCLEDCLSTLKGIKLYNREKYSLDKFSELSYELKQESIFSLRWLTAVAPINNFIGNLNFLLIAVVGGALATSGLSTVSVGTIVLFVLYVREYTETLNDFSEILSEIQPAITAMDRFFDILDAPMETEEEADAIINDGSVEIRNVHFSYTADTEVLSGVNIHIESGQNVAIVGPSGCGKTTLIQLLLRFHDADAGDIFIGGANIQEVSLKELRKNIVAVMQDDIVLDESLSFNLSLGSCDDGVSDFDEIVKILALDEEKIPDSEHLSGGQIQKICVMRAFFVSAKIIVLDESMSLVDPITYTAMTQKIRSIFPHATIIIITHRLNYLQDCDRIFYLSGGEITEEGTFQELVNNNGEFNHMLQIYK